MTTSAPSAPLPKYQLLADHCRGTTQAGALLPGQGMPSLRALMGQHAVSLTTAMQASAACWRARAGWRRGHVRATSCASRSG